jgi:pimeloyl-ACP methyl ester carboxylesterase
VSDLSPEARAIIDAGRDGDSAGDLERARVRRALFAKLAAGGGAALASSSVAAAQGTAATAPIAAAATTALPLAKILVPLAIVAAGSVGGTIAWHARGAAPTHAPAVVLLAPAPAPRVAAPPPAFAPVAPVVTKRPAPRHTVSHPTTLLHEASLATNRLAEETALLASANAALRAGDGARALALLDDYDHRYPAGILREEVLATRIIARCELDAGDATSSADAFLARHPRSPLAPRVRSSCGR